MLKTIEAVLDKNGTIHFKEPIQIKKDQRVLVTLLEQIDENKMVTLLSEKALAKDWLKPEEDQAWAHLQKAM